MSDSLGKQAVVIGAGMAGLTAARALADHFDQVIVPTRYWQAGCRHWLSFSQGLNGVSTTPAPCPFAWPPTTCLNGRGTTRSPRAILAFCSTACRGR